MNVNQSYHHGNLRAELLEEAEIILREQGIEKVTLRELARKVGVSHAAPRRHFKNRQALLDALAVNGFSQLGVLLRHQLNDKKGDFFEQLRSSALVFVYFATQNASLFELMNSSKHQDRGSAIIEASNIAFSPMIALIKEGQNQGVLKIEEPEKSGLNLFAILLGITTMINGGLLDPKYLEDLVSSTLTIFLRGAGPIENEE